MQSPSVSRILFVCTVRSQKSAFNSTAYTLGLDGKPAYDPRVHLSNLSLFTSVSWTQPHTAASSHPGPSFPYILQYPSDIHIFSTMLPPPRTLKTARVLRETKDQPKNIASDAYHFNSSPEKRWNNRTEEPQTKVRAPRPQQARRKTKT
jgi:hypothetical protein